MTAARDSFSSMPASPEPSPQAPRSVWLALILLASTFVGAASGVLSYLGGTNVSLAVLTGGGAFGGTVLLFLTLYRYMTGESQ